MTEAEWDACRLALASSWPDASPLSVEVLDAWRGILDPLPGELVLAAISSLMRDGREFRPPVGVIHRRAVDLEDDAPPWSEAVAKLHELASLECRAEYELASAADYYGHRLIADLVAAVGVDISDPTRYAQARAMYLELVELRNRERRWAGLPGASRPRLTFADDLERARAERAVAEMFAKLGGPVQTQIARVVRAGDGALIVSVDDACSTAQLWEAIAEAQWLVCDAVGLEPDNDVERGLLGVLIGAPKPLTIHEIRERLPGPPLSDDVRRRLVSLAHAGIVVRQPPMGEDAVGVVTWQFAGLPRRGREGSAARRAGPRQRVEALGATAAAVSVPAP